MPRGRPPHSTVSPYDRYLTRGLGKLCGIETEPAFPWPTCKVHYELLARHSDFYGWVWDAQYDPHGPVHIWLGGVLDCEASYARVIDLVGKETGTDLAMLSFIHRKNLYREGLFKCKGSDEDAAGGDAHGVDEGEEVGSKTSLSAPHFFGFRGCTTWNQRGISRYYFPVVKLSKQAFLGGRAPRRTGADCSRFACLTSGPPINSSVLLASPPIKWVPGIRYDTHIMHLRAKQNRVVFQSRLSPPEPRTGEPLSLKKVTRVYIYHLEKKKWGMQLILCFFMFSRHHFHRKRFRGVYMKHETYMWGMRLFLFVCVFMLSRHHFHRKRFRATVCVCVFSCYVATSFERSLGHSVYAVGLCRSPLAFSLLSPSVR